MRRCSRCDWRPVRRGCYGAFCAVCSGIERRGPPPAPTVEPARPVLLRTHQRVVRLSPVDALGIAAQLRTVRGRGRERVPMPAPDVELVDGVVVVRLVDRWIGESVCLTDEQARALADELECASLAARGEAT